MNTLCVCAVWYYLYEVQKFEVKPMCAHPMNVIMWPVNVQGGPKDML